ncbi:MAG: methylenetetrahydrofolate--tRNA-(uracil(54)-C(5))-methyltransferase (FADH(2)-oxidizing) TrmFO [Deltaproteobacteria bacterium]|nr:methylenetetrahydrofolate--tRNA-(uracil(54)-C(5))-methyltransferase (FADH(2)-oxidizing) TrmFO [Deltaproteobacteria bacterium]
MTITVVGAGLAGCEAAWQLAERGVDVRLIEMKPLERSPAHDADGMAELVCSNSFRGAGLTSAVGLLKEELRSLGSLLIGVADETAVPAGRALAVDRNLFSKAVEKAMSAHPRIEIVRRRADDLPEGRVIVATGPLTGGALKDALTASGALLYYHDAIAPLVTADSIESSTIFHASRYEQEEGDYINCPFDERGYYRFVDALVLAEKTPLHDFEHAPFFEGCLPVEELAVRGPLTLAHGPLKPVGLIDPSTGKRPFAVVQLRREDKQGTVYNIVGFQTRLTRPEQKRVFRMIPGLEKARFARLGQVHRNSFVDAPKVLDGRLGLRSDPRVSLAGQLAGVEGYVESIACGLAAGLLAAAECRGIDLQPLPTTTALGGLMRFLTVERKNFQPSNVLWMMIDKPPRLRRQGKRPHREAAAKLALEHLDTWKSISQSYP